ncbi:MAG TPA: tetratricopeptide repeat protein [Thermoanaerobaculia bacterium]|jgi:tetratricopeptide (TPR) repeat protein
MSEHARAIPGYGTRDVARMIGLSEAQVRSWVHAGFVSPSRGPRGAFLFSFADLVLLRAARGLARSRIGPIRIRRTLDRLREQLPPGRSLAGLRFAAMAGRVVVGDEAASWQPESGQVLFDFGAEELGKKARPLVRRAFREARAAGEDLEARDWFAWGCELEASSPAEAADAYRKAIDADPSHADAMINLGRLRQQDGHPEEAERLYRTALARRPDDATAAFNLGVALDELGRPADAAAAYERALRADPESADAHWNLARLYEEAGRARDALRHLRAYRELTRSDPS